MGVFHDPGRLSRESGCRREWNTGLLITPGQVAQRQFLFLLSDKTHLCHHVQSSKFRDQVSGPALRPVVRSFMRSMKPTAKKGPGFRERPGFRGQRSGFWVQSSLLPTPYCHLFTSLSVLNPQFCTTGVLPSALALLRLTRPPCPAKLAERSMGPAFRYLISDFRPLISALTCTEGA